MTFVSLEFAILLLFCLACFFWLPNRGRVMLLLVASYVFYAYWKPWYAILILFSTSVDYWAGRWMAVTENQKQRRLALCLSLATNLGLLGYFKYANFGLHVLHGLFGTWAAPLPSAFEVILPVGISFYTFQGMSYAMDVYRRTIPSERSFTNFALYISFFAQLVAGPIERAGDLLPQLKQFRPFDRELFERGFCLLIWGFAKKLVVADRLLAVAQPIMQSTTPHTAPDLLFASLAMVAVFYYDFSAYTDMARGTAAMFGVRLSENFHLPLAATSIVEFWQSWHMTLSTWVRDYVFRPLGGMHPKNFTHQALALLTTMGLVGLWHGANWTYVIWGLHNGFMMMIYQIYFRTLRRKLRKQAWFNSRWYAFLGWAATMAIHAVGMIWFFSPSVSRAWELLCRFMTPDAWTSPQYLVTAPGASILAGLWALQAISRWWQPLDRIAGAKAPMRALAYAALIFGIIGLGVTEGSVFVYFQF